MKFMKYKLWAEDSLVVKISSCKVPSVEKKYIAIIYGCHQCVCASTQVYIYMSVCMLRLYI